MPSLFSVNLCYVERARDAPVRIEPEERATSMARRARHRDRGLGARPRADLGGELEHGEGAETGETPDTGADTDVDTDSGTDSSTDSSSGGELESGDGDAADEPAERQASIKKQKQKQKQKKSKVSKSHRAKKRTVASKPKASADRAEKNRRRKVCSAEDLSPRQRAACRRQQRTTTQHEPEP